MKRTLRRLVELPSGGQCANETDPARAAAAQNAVNAVGREQRGGLAALSLGPFADVLVKVAAHVDSSPAT